MLHLDALWYLKNILALLTMSFAMLLFVSKICHIVDTLSWRKSISTFWRICKITYFDVILKCRKFFMCEKGGYNKYLDILPTICLVYMSSSMYLVTQIELDLPSSSSTVKSYVG